MNYTVLPRVCKHLVTAGTIHGIQFYMQVGILLHDGKWPIIIMKYVICME
jgi:hypothetical protein